MSLQRYFVYGNYIDEPLVMHRESDDKDYYYAQDHLYSVVALTDDNGSVVERYEYDAYGTVHILDAGYNTRTVSSYGNSYAFTGRRMDALELDGSNIQQLLKYHLRHRDTDPYTGRFYQQDLLGYIDGLNMYTYVKSNSLIYGDPFGLTYEIIMPGGTLPPGPEDTISGALCVICEEAVLAVTDGYLEEAFRNFAGLSGRRDPITLTDSQMEELFSEYNLREGLIKPLVETCKNSTGWGTRQISGEIDGAYYIGIGDAGGWRGTLNSIEYTIRTQCRCFHNQKMLVWHFSFSDPWDFNNLKGDTWKEKIVDNLARNIIVGLVSTPNWLFQCGWKPFVYKGDKAGAEVAE